MEKSLEISSKKKESLISTNFLLLWQAQLVSGLGDMVYEIALGFWVLAFTKSTLIMSMLMASTMLPRVIMSPFAGVIVDKSNRKKLLVLMDILRGVSVVLVGIAAITGYIQVWMVFAAGIIIGTCGAFFGPAVGSAIPDIVPKTLLMKANGAFSMIFAGSNIAGSAAGGVLFQIFGAPLLFLFNGISYLASAFSITFMKIPKLAKEGHAVNFKKDIIEGLVFVWNFKGLRYLIIIAAFLNYFAGMAMTLFIPYFNQSPDLGVKKYGFASALLGVGMFSGMLFTTIYNIKPKNRLVVFAIAAFISSITFACVPVFNNFTAMLSMLFIGGFFNSIINVFFQASIQLTVPQDMRGKVFSLIGTVTQGLTPLAMVTAGVVSKFVAIPNIIICCFVLNFIMFIPFIFMNSFKKFINFDPEKQTLEDII
jgi:DHA3 family macrolide efflux protein-like MFS transporter